MTGHDAQRASRTPQYFARQCSVQQQARPLRPPAGLVGQANPPRQGATWAKCARTVAQRTQTRNGLGLRLACVARNASCSCRQTVLQRSKREALA